MRLRDFGYLLAFVPALLPLLAVALAPGIGMDASAWLPFAVIYGLVPLLDAITGVDASNADPAQQSRLDGAIHFRVLTWLVAGAWLLLLAWSLHQWTLLPPGVSARLGWLASIGTLGGVLAINVAHELIHKPGRFEPWLGGLLLTSVGYPGFAVEHLRGHHVHVATPLDGSSARRGESVYPFIARALWHNPRRAWQLESARLRRRGQSVLSTHNSLLGWWLLWLVALVTIAALLGASAALFFVAQGVIAAATLEVINYVEHYGLERRRLADGHYERVGHAHSWNADARLSNWLLFQLPRHADHHAHARRRYQVLRHHDDSPQLPAGYATMFVLALVPPLWRRVMDSRVERWHREGIPPAAA
jgi:alkane 1-monooxygenase